MSNVDYYLDNLRVNDKPLTDLQKKKFKEQIEKGYTDVILMKKRGPGYTIMQKVK